MTKYFIIYEVKRNKEGEVIDITNKFDSDNLQTISEWLNLDYKNLSHYTVKDIDNINCRLKDNKYFIFKDYE